MNWMEYMESPSKSEVGCMHNPGCYEWTNRPGVCYNIYKYINNSCV